MKKIDRSERLRRYHKWDQNFFLELNDKAPIKKPLDKITQYVDGRRVLPAGSPKAGLFSWDVNPMMKHLQDRLSFADPVRFIDGLKGVQATITTLVENDVVYSIGEDPRECMYISGTDKLLKEWLEIRLEAAIDSMDLRDNIRQQYGNQKNRKSGDTQDAKFFAGGSMHLGSARSTPGMRMKSKQKIWVDEASSAPKELTTGEGNYVAVLEGRMVAYGKRTKMIVFSTSTTYENCVVWPRYKLGDQLHCYFPCPHCGAYFTFSTMDADNEKIDWSGFNAEIDKKGRLKEVWFECPHCFELDGKKIYNHHKHEMFPDYEWKPHAEAYSEDRTSYYIPSFLSPIGFLDWEEIYQKYLDALEDPSRMPTFVNLYLGGPYKQIGEKPKLAHMKELRSGYERGTVPDGVLFLTMAVDVQRGEKGNKSKKQKPARLEVEICGHGEGRRTWSIDYWVINGDTRDPNDGAWEELYQKILRGEMACERSDGLVFVPRMILADSGDGVWHHTTYAWCERLEKTYPCKGIGGDGLKRRMGEKKEDAVSNSNMMRYRMALMKEGVQVVQMSTNYYKSILYGCLRKRPGLDGKIPTGYCSFPSDYEDEYFKQLTAEERLQNGTFLKTTRAHEALDLRVYNMTAGDVQLDMLLEALRQEYRDRKRPQMEVAMLTKADVLRLLEEQTKRID